MIHSLYIHIPFCKNICSYCDFPKIYYQHDLCNQYLQCLEKELSLIHQTFETIYIGGGTPDSLTDIQFEYLLSMIQPFIDDKTLEISIECHPELLNDTKIKLLSKYHINRVSLGVQTFQTSLHQNRSVDYSLIQEVISKLQYYHISNINIDMMYGLPRQSFEDIKEDIRLLNTLDITHISYYSLILEEHTKLYYSDFEPIDEDTDIKYMTYIQEHLSSFHHYEVSNFAKKGYESKHNKNYWLYKNYYGAGCGAVGKIDNKMYSHTRSISHYINGQEPYIQTLTKEETMFNHIMMSLRLYEGLDIKDFNDLYHIDILDYYKEPLLKNKDHFIIDTHLRVKKESVMILHNILVDFL